MANEGHQSILQNLIRYLKDGIKCWVKQGELFILALLNNVAAFPVAFYHLEKSSDHDNIKSACLRYDCM